MPPHPASSCRQKLPPPLTHLSSHTAQLQHLGGGGTEPVTVKLCKYAAMPFMHKIAWMHICMIPQGVTSTMALGKAGSLPSSSTMGAPTPSVEKPVPLTPPWVAGACNALQVERQRPSCLSQPPQARRLGPVSSSQGDDNLARGAPTLLEMPWGTRSPVQEVGGWEAIRL